MSLTAYKTCRLSLCPLPALQETSYQQVQMIASLHSLIHPKHMFVEEALGVSAAQQLKLS